MDRFAGRGDSACLRRAEDRATADQTAQPAREPGGDSSARPNADGQAGGAVSVDAVGRHPRRRRAEGVGDGEGAEDPAVLRAREMKLRPHQRGQRGERLAVEIVDGGGEHEDRQQEPAEARRTIGVDHWNSMVATSPAVASLTLGLGKYSMATRRGFCTPHPRFNWPPPATKTCAGSTRSLTVLWSAPSTTRRACLPRQSTCLSVPVILPERKSVAEVN